MVDDSDRYAREKFGVQKGISSDEFFGRGTLDGRKTRRLNNNTVATLRALRGIS